METTPAVRASAPTTSPHTSASLRLGPQAGPSSAAPTGVAPSRTAVVALSVRPGMRMGEGGSDQASASGGGRGGRAALEWGASRDEGLGFSSPGARIRTSPAAAGLCPPRADGTGSSAGRSGNPPERTARRASRAGRSGNPPEPTARRASRVVRSGNPPERTARRASRASASSSLVPLDSAARARPSSGARASGSSRAAGRAGVPAALVRVGDVPAGGGCCDLWARRRGRAACSEPTSARMCSSAARIFGEVLAGSSTLA